MQPVIYEPIIFNIMPTGEEVAGAVEWAGFARPLARRVVDKGFKGLYRIILPGYADVPAYIVDMLLAAAFCEQVNVLSLRTKGDDVYILMKLVALPGLEPHS